MTTRLECKERAATDRQDTYYNTRTAVLVTLETVKRQILSHGSFAAGGKYHWGYIGDMTAILDHLQHLPVALTPR